MKRICAAISPLAMLCAVAGCGGGEGDGGSGSLPPPSGSAPTPVPAPAPAPAPAPTPAPSGAVAAASEGLNPDGAATLLVEIKATNAGVYVLGDPVDDALPSKIFKVQGSPAQAQSWIGAVPDSDPGALIVSFAPTNIYSEADRAVSFLWTSHEADRSRFNKWGSYTANTGGISITASEDALFGSTLGRFTELVVAGAVNGTVAPRSWLITQRRGATDPYAVFQDDGAYTAANTISDRFSTPATPDLPQGPEVAVSHPSDPHLYVAAGSRLYVYDAQRLLRSFQFPTTDPVAQFSDLVWADGNLYISYGANIYRLSGNTVTTLMPIPLYVGGRLPGRFCIMGGWLYTIDGTARSLANNTTRDWISRGTLTAEQSAAAASLRGGLGGGVFCAANNGNAIWSYYPTLSGQRGIRRITPLS